MAFIDFLDPLTWIIGAGIIVVVIFILILVKLVIGKKY